MFSVSLQSVYLLAQFTDVFWHQWMAGIKLFFLFPHYQTREPHFDQPKLLITTLWITVDLKKHVARVIACLYETMEFITDWAIIKYEKFGSTLSDKHLNPTVKWHSNILSFRRVRKLWGKKNSHHNLPVFKALSLLVLSDQESKTQIY